MLKTQIERITEGVLRKLATELEDIEKDLQ